MISICPKLRFILSTIISSCLVSMVQTPPGAVFLLFLSDYIIVSSLFYRSNINDELVTFYLKFDINFWFHWGIKDMCWRNILVSWCGFEINSNCINTSKVLLDFLAIGIRLLGRIFAYFLVESIFVIVFPTSLVAKHLNV